MRSKGLDRPVVTAARQALERGDVNRVLVRVRAEDAAEIQDAFMEAIAGRRRNPQAPALADRFFFESLVRLHRAGRGAPDTGLKPAGRDLGRAIPAADKAIETGSEEALIQIPTDKMQEGLRAQFETVIEKKAYTPDDVSAGHKYVETCVTFIHYV